MYNLCLLQIWIQFCAEKDKILNGLT